ncbi:MAG TPA: type II toxin-antitoxin system VapC family toxin [Longimicrobiales bacterium]|nr:type II toxin-antitoxin system VapC family toxin [Longimicrobiales bacterium]
MIVVDANVVLYLLTPGSHSELAWAAAERDDDWRVPTLWRSEVRNALLGIVRAGQLDAADAIASMNRAERLLIGSSHGVDSAHVLELAMSSGCSAYDCEYVSLARTLDVPLLTSDSEILAAFPERPVDLRTYAAGR